MKEIHLTVADVRNRFKKNSMVPMVMFTQHLVISEQTVLG